MTNPWKRLEQLLPNNPLLVGDVILHNGDGTSTITLPDGREIRVRGQSVAVGEKAFIQGGEIRSQAPNLTVVNITV
ncbi:conserved hypothetical protein [Nitrosococcus halophilus Nc 4]|uniref:Uncharacterized protein n=1 Tax=Nitrosococcus halophilus (strain Nc4) TaxID=472759 RepID=D5BYX5_NITHN|nr:hypothetical protein [Nitrosococcus halophilus]ADE14188.1 conserved hypothetical protein [Nitrosococcus halophilus Nc 4]